MSALAIFTSQTTETANTLSAAASFPVCYRDAVLADTPVSYWRLDETSGTSAVDSKNGRNGTYTNGPTLGQSGALPDTNDKAVSFDGNNDYVTVPYAAALNPSTFTVEAWAKVTGGQGNWRTVAATEDDNNNKGYWLGAGDDNLWHFQIAPNPYGGGSWPQVLGPPVKLNDWVHVVGTYDGSTAKLYLNGILAGSVSVTIGVNTVRPMGIGAYNGSGSTWSLNFAGPIDEVALYNTALSATQVRTHYNTGRCYKDGVFADGPVGYWRLGESSGATAADAFRRDGTYAGTPTLAATGALNGDSNTAVTLNGSSQYVSVPYDSALNPGQVTLEAWAKPTGGAGTARTVVAAQDTNKGYLLGIGTDDKWRFTIGTGAATTVVTGSTVTLSSWAHLVATYNGTTATLYVDGLSVGTASVTVSVNTTQPLGIGATDAGGSWAGYFPGSLDEVALYGSALSSTRVQAHYLLGRSYNDTVLDSAPVSYWRLGEGSGTSAADGNGSNTGTYTNGPVLAQAGALAADADTAVKFDGSNDYLTVPNVAALNPAQFTVEAWVNPVSVSGGYREVAGSYDEAPTTRNIKGYWLGSNGTNWVFETGNGTTTTPAVTGSASTLASWTHLVGTYDGTTLRLYVNGTLTSVAGGYQANALSPFQVGATYYRFNGTNLDFFNGTIDDVAVYNRALSTTEVQLHYDSGRQ